MVSKVDREAAIAAAVASIVIIILILVKSCGSTTLVCGLAVCAIEPYLRVPLRPLALDVCVCERLCVRLCTLGVARACLCVRVCVSEQATERLSERASQ